MMTEREKVIKSIEEAIQNFSRYSGDEYGREYDYARVGVDVLENALALLKAQEPEALDMPKPDSDIGCWYDITHNYTLEQVVSALKAQEARLVTEADFENADPYGYLPVWVEEKDDNEIICDCITKYAITEPDEDYHYRYWTSHPTDEQREATPWN